MFDLACFDLITEEEEEKPFSWHNTKDPRIKLAFTIKSFKDQRSKEL